MFTKGGRDDPLFFVFFFLSFFLFFSRGPFLRRPKGEGGCDDPAIGVLLGEINGPGR